MGIGVTWRTNPTIGRCRPVYAGTVWGGKERQMVSNIAGGRPPQQGVEPGAQLGALEVYAAQAHGYLSAGGDQHARLAGLLRPAVLESWLRSVRDGVDPMD